MATRQRSRRRTAAQDALTHLARAVRTTSGCCVARTPNYGPRTRPLQAQLMNTSDEILRRGMHEVASGGTALHLGRREC
jgi:hypothetical protein